jgi:5-(carboxyamino)imidazole ribonucleotide synthase
MRVGILGGGQLAQMMAQAGAGLDMAFMFLCPDAQACAAPYGEHVCAPFDDSDAKRKLVDWADVVTYEFENIPAGHVQSLERQIELHPSSRVLSVAQDRLLEKRCFRSLGIATADFAPVDSLHDLQRASVSVGLPAILKTRTMGYDGKGQVLLRRPEQLADAWAQTGGVPCILESLVGFSRELSVIGARGKTGETVFYPVSQNHHREGILRLSLSCQGDPLQAKAEALMRNLMTELDYVGVLALELFQVGDELYANEMAPRVHNTGHWTIEGAPASQFVNHLRAVCGLPMGATDAPAKAAMVNLIGRLVDADQVREIPGATAHFYGKAERPGRKVGHITLIEGDEGPQGFARGLRRLLELAGEQELARLTAAGR